MRPFSLSDFSGDTRFTAAVARVRVLEKELLGRHRLERMAQMASRAEVVEALRGTPYGEVIETVSDAAALDAAFGVLHARAIEQVRLIGLRPAFVMALQLPAEALRLKALLPPLLEGRSPLGESSGEGAVTSEQIQERLRGGAMLPHPFDEAVEAAAAEYQKHRIVGRAEMAADRAFAGYVARVFDESGLPFAAHLGRLFVDRANLLTVLRWKRWADVLPGESQALPMHLLPESGFVPSDALKELAVAPWDRAAEVLSHTSYAAAVDEACGANKAEGLGRLEVLLDEGITDFCLQARFTPFGQEPLLAYAWLVQQELLNLRLVVRAKFSAAAASAVIARLRRVHAA
jgi:V/A-type H+/Na+-transporting ATPase subunit C